MVGIFDLQAYLSASTHCGDKEKLLYPTQSLNLGGRWFFQ